MFISDINFFVTHIGDFDTHTEFIQRSANAQDSLNIKEKIRSMYTYSDCDII